LGGDQMHPFLMFPAEWELENEKIVGADAVYTVLKGWLKQGMIEHRALERAD
jgi:hypothetical protein